jgi:DUF4097 and DUF4098 domain-containing protein YvlB
MKNVSYLYALVFIVSACASDFHKTEEMKVSANGIEELKIGCGPGFLKITGRKDLNDIRVKADITLGDVDIKEVEEQLHKIIDLSLEKKGNRAYLVSFFEKDHSFFSSLFEQWGNTFIDLTVEIPSKMDLIINDGSWIIEIQTVEGTVNIEDGSGSIAIKDGKGSYEIDDGSGSIDILNSDIDVNIKDGSGSINLTNLVGNVDITDGSGSVTIEKISGNVVVGDGSGSIFIDEVENDVTITESGSGGVDINHVLGKVFRYDDD